MAYGWSDLQLACGFRLGYEDDRMTELAIQHEREAVALPLATP